MTDHFLFIVFQMKSLFHQMVSFHQLACRKTQWYAGRFRMVLDQVHNAVKGPMYRPLMVQRAAEIPDARFFPVPCHMDCVTHQFLHPLVSGGGNGNHRNLQNFFHFINQDGTAVLFHLVHHIESQHHGHVQLHKLHGEVQVAFQVGGIHNVDNGTGFLFQNEFTGNDFLTGIGRQGINSRKIHHFTVRMAFDKTALPVYGNAGEIAHMLVGPGELVEKSGFPAVLVSCQRKNELPLHRLCIMVR